MVTISREEFDRVVQEVLTEMPERFSRHLENVVFVVDDVPTAELRNRYELPGDLLGFYEGVPVTESSVVEPAVDLDRIYLFRENLCAFSQTREMLAEEIRITLLHEVGHHFGLDEDRLAELGYG
jgi:predicted Zn-dependent protease with MMP-like domain